MYTYSMKTDKYLWEILVPVTIDGLKVKVAHHRKWDAEVRKISGGLTIMKTSKGQWESCGGKLFKEKMIPVRISCSENDIEEIMSLTLSHYRQDEVMAYRISDCVKFMSA